MTVNLNCIKKYSNSSILRNCWNCQQVKPLYKLPSDVYQKLNKLAVLDLTVYNPYTATLNKASLSIDLNKSQILTLDQILNSRRANLPLTLEYNPQNTAIIFEKKLNPLSKTMQKKPIDIVILQSTSEDANTSYHFMKKDLSEEIGYVTIIDCKKLRRSDSQLYEGNKRIDPILQDYPSLGIKGDRIVIDYLQNWDDKKYSGVGLLADKLSVKYCLENNIKPVIVSQADEGSHIAHYKRGKRFFIPKDDTIAADFFQSNYGKKNPNEIIKELLEKSSDEKFELKNWTRTPMYMPQELIEKYIQILKNS